MWLWSQAGTACSFSHMYLFPFTLYDEEAQYDELILDVMILKEKSQI